MNEPLSMQEYCEASQSILEELLRLMEFEDARLEATLAEDQIFFQIITEDAGRIIGRTSQTLDAIQFLLNRLLSRKYDESPYCVVDAEHYRERRREKLLADVKEALERVRANGQSWRMPLLNSMERRIVHQALRDCPDVRTESEDEMSDGRKRVVISLSEINLPEAEAPATEPAPSEEEPPPADPA
jgi:spoIIIJ-associated protein